MSISPYKDGGPVDCSVEPDLTKLKGKNVLVTGGSNGLGSAYVQAFLKAGAYVTNADLQPPKDYSPPTDGTYQHIPCDVTNFQQQLTAFKAALKLAPSGVLDIVIPNAGVTGQDHLWNLQDPSNGDPTEPKTTTLDINLKGVLYTAHLAMHYWQPSLDSRPPEQKCLILKSSLAGYVDLPAAIQYQTSKYGVRGLMVNLRVSGRCRVNLIAPWFIQTDIMSAETIGALGGLMSAFGTDFASADDAVKAVLRAVCDEKVHGRAFGVVPRVKVKGGLMDLNVDEYINAKDEYLKGAVDCVRKLEQVYTGAH